MSRALAGVVTWSFGVDVELRCRRVARALDLRDDTCALFFNDASFRGEAYPSRFLQQRKINDLPVDAALNVVGDLRIDNRREFALRCGLSAETIVGLSDVELITLGWNCCGERIFDALVGAYAVAIWCRRSKQLVLARDPQGMRPLFFYRHDDWVAFSSLPNALAVLPEIGRNLNEERVAELLLLVDPQGNTSFFDGVEGVRKGEIVRFEGPGRMHKRQFWDAREIKIERRHPDDYAEGLRERLVQAVASAIDTRRPIATTLSGGFDSSVVTSLAAGQLLGQGRGLIAYTAVPAIEDPLSTDPRWLDDETELAAAVARGHANIRHRCIVPPAGSLIPVFDFFFDYVGAPCQMPTVVHWYAEIERQAAADGAEILLRATGGNATISYHGVPLLNRLVDQGRWLAVLGWLWRLRGGHPSLSREKLIRMLLRKRFGEAGWERLRRLAGKRPRPPWTAAPPIWSAVAGERLTEFLADLDLNSPRLEILHGGLGRCSDRRVWLMRETLLPLYEKAVWLQRGIEVRDPTLDRRVVEYCLSIPDEEFLRGGQARAVYRRAFAKDVPGEILANQQIGRQGYGRRSNMQRSLSGFRDEIDRVPEHSSAHRLFDLAGLAELAETSPDSDDGSVAFDLAYTQKLSRGIAALHFVNRMSSGN